MSLESWELKKINWLEGKTNRAGDDANRADWTDCWENQKGNSGFADSAWKHTRAAHWNYLLDDVVVQSCQLCIRTDKARIFPGITSYSETLNLSLTGQWWAHGRPHDASLAWPLTKELQNAWRQTVAVPIARTSLTSLLPRDLLLQCFLPRNHVLFLNVCSELSDTRYSAITKMEFQTPHLKILIRIQILAFLSFSFRDYSIN